MPPYHIRIGDLLLSRGLVTQANLSLALAYQKKTRARLGRILVLQGSIAESELLATLADQLETEVWDLEANRPSEDALNIVPPATCKKFRFVPVALKDGVLTIAMSDPEDIEVIDALMATLRVRIRPVFALTASLEARLAEMSGHEQSVFDVVSQALEVVGDSAQDQVDEDLVTDFDTAPVMALVNQVILDAIDRKASDIHFEPCKHVLEVRIRVDGHLRTLREFPLSLLSMVVARIKIMAELDISERRKSQDGRFSVKLRNVLFDVRTSVLPTRHGERVVLRILDGAVADRSLTQLGFSPENHRLFLDLIARPYGFILVTGPTGSGKSTTLYAAMNEIRDPTKNVMTCEDPIEYEMEGVAQSQVHERIGLTFARQLRSMLRQDPDIMLVGEIRDKETAETAIRASMTGHLVLSTLHCNDAVSAFPRLFDMGAEPYLLSTSLIGVTAQRLLRVLCPHCKSEESPKDSEMAVWQNYFDSRPFPSVFRPVGCPECDNVGYKGRMGVHEILPVKKELATKVSERASEEVLTSMAKGMGYRRIQLDALDRVVQGETSFEEACRVVAFESVAPGQVVRPAA